MPRPTVRLKVEETPQSATPETAPLTQVPVMMEAGPIGLDVGLSLAAAVLSVAVLGYLAFSIYK